MTDVFSTIGEFAFSAPDTPTAACGPLHMPYAVATARTWLGMRASSHAHRAVTEPTVHMLLLQLLSGAHTGVGAEVASMAAQDDDGQSPLGRPAGLARREGSVASEMHALPHDAASNMVRLARSRLLLCIS